MYKDLVPYCLCFFLLMNCSSVDRKELSPFSSKENLWGYRDYTSQKVIIDPQYNLAYPFINYYAIVGLSEANEDNCLFGVIDTLGEYILKPEYNRIYIDDKYLYAKKDSLIRIFSFNMTEVVPQISNDSSTIASNQLTFSLKPENTVNMLDNKKVIVKDTAGKIVFSEQYGWTGLPAYSEGLMAFCNLNEFRKWGFIDIQGKLVIPYMYDYIDTFGFDNGFAIVSEKGENPTMNKQAVINKKK